MLFRNKRVWIGLAFMLISLLTINFAIRGVQHGRRLRARPDEPIQGWMNIRHIAHSYHVPPDVIHQALGLPPKPDRRPLVRIAVDTGRTTDAVIADVMAAIQQFRAARPPDPPAPPSPPEQPRTP
jgi:hypothetical protein